MKNKKVVPKTNFILIISLIASLSFISFPGSSQNSPVALTNDQKIHYRDSIIETIDNLYLKVMYHKSRPSKITTPISPDSVVNVLTTVFIDESIKGVKLVEVNEAHPNNKYDIKYYFLRGELICIEIGKMRLEGKNTYYQDGRKRYYLDKNETLTIKEIGQGTDYSLEYLKSRSEAVKDLDMP